VGTVVARVSSGEAAKVSSKKEEPKKIEEQVPVQKPKEEPAAMHDNFSNIITQQKEDKKYEDEKKTSSRFYSPLVMNIAQKENVSYDELEKIQGTGLDGRVSKKDILSYIENRKASKPQPVIEKEQPRKEFEKSISEM